MSTRTGTEIDAWLRRGGRVLAASERAARALTLGFHRRRQADGERAWSSPRIQDWKTFVHEEWLERSRGDVVVLNAVQEQALWAGIAAADGHLATQLEGPRYRLAGLAMRAHELLCAYAPQALRTSARTGWQNDAGAFSQWLTGFDERCQQSGLLSAARQPLQLLQLLQGSADNNSPATLKKSPARTPILLAGFDRILPVQGEVFDAWGEWRQLAPDPPATRVDFYQCADGQAEIAACVTWCSREIEANPGARLLVITQDASSLRGPIERAFLEQPGARLNFEFTLGTPLSQTPLPRAALLLLRWLSGSLSEHQIDWLFSSSYAGNKSETAALQAHMRSLRRRGLEQPDWTLRAFLQPIAARPESDHPLKEWARRVTAEQRRLVELARRPHSPLEWAELVPQMLVSLRFAAASPRSSGDFQLFERWQDALETAGSLGFDGHLIDWHEFLSALTRALDDTLFAEESRNAPILIAGPAEASGLAASAIWFLGMSEDAWPTGGSTNPLLPLDLQRQAGMPHATAQLDLELAEIITERLLASAAKVTCSYPRQAKGVEARPSRLILQRGIAPQPLPAEYRTPIKARDLTESIEDTSRIAFAAGQIDGGASVLTAQSQCPFKAFATARLGAQGWEPAHPGLNPSQRGQLLHSVLHAVWAGPPDGIRTHAELLRLADRPDFILNHVASSFKAGVPPSLRDRLPARYLELEQQRLTRLLDEWLAYESMRIPFEVVETEAERTKPVAGLTLKLRLDRLDLLIDGSVMVVDYKTGDVSQKAWDPPRAEDVQLPLYARFALDDEQELGGLAFAKVRPGDLVFAGCIGAPTQTLFRDLKSISALAKNALTLDQLLDWEQSIEQLARDFLAGHAEVDPRDYPKTCQRCGLQSLCRIQEQQMASAIEDEAGEGVPGTASDE